MVALPSLRLLLLSNGGMRHLAHPLVALRLASVIPAAAGFIFNVIDAFQSPPRVATFMDAMSTSLDHWIASSWCIMSAVVSYQLVDHLIRRWLMVMDVPGTIYRACIWYIGSWLLSVIILLHYGQDLAIWSWFLITNAHMIAWVADMYRNPGRPRAKDPESRSGHVRTPSVVLTDLTWASFQTTVAILCGVSLASVVLLLRAEQDARYLNNAGTAFSLANKLTLADMDPQSGVKVLLVILSSWTESGMRKRRTFREATLRLAPKKSPRISFAYRFILGGPPGPLEHKNMGPRIQEENDAYGDILTVPAADTYEDLSHKLYKALVWSDGFDFDYLLKTDDDIFVRLDTVTDELVQAHPLRWYWRGLAYWDIPPIHDVKNKNAALDYTLPMFPPFVAGAFYIMSRDIIHRLVSDGPRLFTKNEDQNLGIWLFPYNIRPVHDRRIQQVDVCENDMIAKHFSDHFEEMPSMTVMYDNVVNGRPMCKGFRQIYCAICYPCKGRKNHYNSWNFDCDPVRGITLLRQIGVQTEKSELELSAIDPPTPLPTYEQGDKSGDSAELSVTDDWIIPNLLRPSSCTLSETNDWHLVHWVMWTTDASTFHERHYRTLDLIYAHQPRAIVMVLTPTLPMNFFSEYSSSGYNIHIIRTTRDKIISYGWFLGPNSEWWVRRLTQWSKSPYYFSHLTDYLRYIVLYKYGGVYMDMDALWLRIPPESESQFIGSDISAAQNDAEWALDVQGTYLAPGVMRFKRGWRVFKETVESTFDRDYNPECFNCVGPKAITTNVRWQRKYLTLHGFRILPSDLLYPYGYRRVHKLLKKDAMASEIVESLMDRAWSLHLFGKMTNSKPIEAGSVVSVLFQRFGLMIPSRESGTAIPFTLIGPPRYHRPETASSSTWAGAGGDPGTFQGLDAIIARGGKPGSADLELTISVNQGRLAWGHSGAEFRESKISAPASTLGDINRLFAELRYHWHEADNSSKGDSEQDDELTIVCVFGGETASLRISVAAPKPGVWGEWRIV